MYVPTSNMNENLRVREIKVLLHDAERLSEDFPEACLTTLRKLWEASILELGERYELTNKIKKSGLDLINQVFISLYHHIPARLYYYLQHIKSMGNYASHFQEDGVQPSQEDIVYCIYAAKEFVQWMNQVKAEVHEEFIRIIIDAVPCSECGKDVGEKCITKNGEFVDNNCEHAIRKNEYATYRRNQQKRYATTLVDCMHEMIKDMRLMKDDELSHKDICNWFDEKYPAYLESSIKTHAMIMATNLKTRLHHNFDNDGKYDLFFAIKNKFRLYDYVNDPKPLYKMKQE